MRNIIYTHVVFEFLHIHVGETKSNQIVYNYAIENARGNIIRKGSFNPPHVQLRMQHQEEGKYKLMLWHEDVLCHEGVFIKPAENWEGNNLDLLMPPMPLVLGVSM